MHTSLKLVGGRRREILQRRNGFFTRKSMSNNIKDPQFENSLDEDNNENIKPTVNYKYDQM